MGLNSDQLDAFFEVARQKSFSKAARTLAISQPALSQRIQKLEDDVRSALFIRSVQGGVKLTDLGEALLAHYRNRHALEEDFMNRYVLGNPGHSGRVRLAGFSSIMRSVVLPSLDPLIRQSPRVGIEIYTGEVSDLPGLFRQGQAEFVFTIEPIRLGTVESFQVGHEEYVLVESSKKGTIPDIYFDHDPDDSTTLDFLKRKFSIKQLQQVRRSYLDEIYGIIDAVERGWGRAVLPRHLIDSRPSRLREVPEWPIMRVPVHLNVLVQAVETPLHTAVKAMLLEGVRSRLKTNN